MAENWDLQRLVPWRGAAVFSSEGKKVGEVTEIVYDYFSGGPVWIGLGSGLLGVRTLLVPAKDALAEGDHLRVAYTKDTLIGQPHVDMGEGFDSLTDERHIYAYFGVPLDEKRDVRVLRIGEDLPGLERVITEHER